MKINRFNKYTGIELKLESQGITFHHLDYDTSELDGGTTYYHCFYSGAGAVLNELFVSHKSTFGDLLV